ncbi:MAG: hypothetical protein A2653_03195 [Candidatus Zambryskibacteria bacterium RIFCSPHIGHO2_01_FULL_43_25]|uniref:Uncharacterized protein n=1 Tax=Candidatus Zambryskibacteria bacterium RIFCSPLOWO2_01_FULL_45_21 TaxID=1802761 RepID=A0A1G2U6M6_9BACT|nr:MAG: hypothetical protein A2653_03195 [Candidatus Zambryskibacteria bacterium RIFCSPHIGHO2_01_FULL_43_25]OHB00625.1 MAG: hypothetical protein A3E94_03260 [Candidatus Zambryskibacteria bacterium RIFCSPHIGHO2_12_FULL_44_12b]OHB04650.1 MAG: hypothetical protein A3B14_01620 [Candidatus Zambryskibacteria bacterium RIFCSPLOWO2_01_FULL_45_21]
MNRFELVEEPQPPIEVDKEGNKIENVPGAELTPGAIEPEPTEEQEPSIREIGRERIEKIGSFFSNIKEGFKNKARQAGEAVLRAAGRAKEAGIAGLETAMATPEIIGRGIEYGVGATVVAYEKSKETAIAARDRVVEAKDAVIQKGKNAVEQGIRTVVDAKDATIEFGNRALYRAAERVSRPFLEFQSRRLSQTLQYVAERIERGEARIDDFDQVRRLLDHLEGLKTV